MEFVETPVFTRRLVALLSDDDYRQLQLALAMNPKAGLVIPGSGGLRKMRWAAKGHGKRGGVRTIYYHYQEQDTCFMLVVYAKNERDDLSRRELQVLAALVEAER